MRIARLVPSIPPLDQAYGYYVTFHMLTEAQKKLGNEVTVFHPSRIGRRQEWVEGAVNPLSSIIPGGLSFGANLSKILEDFDVIHAHARSGLPYAFLREKGPPLVVHLHGLPYNITDPRYSPGSLRDNIFDLRSFLDYRAMLRRADHVITYCKSLAKRVVDIFNLDPGRVSWVNNGVDPKIFASETNNRKKLGIEDEPVLIYVGRFTAIKGVYELLKALPKLREDYPHLKILFIGCSEEEIRKEFPKPIESLTAVRHVPYREIPSYYRTANAHIAITRVYGYQKTVLESLASCVPVVASDNPDNRAVIRSAGVYVDPKQPDDIVEGIKKILIEEGRYKTTAKKMSERILQEYSWNRAVTKIQGVYEKII